MQTLLRRDGTETERDSDSEAGSTGHSEWDAEATRVLDLRSAAERPVDAVFDALEEGTEEADLLVLTRAAPIPLYDRLEERGWSYEAVRSEADEWRIHVTADGKEPSGERLRRPRWRGHE